MLVYRHPGLFFRVYPASWKKFFYHFEVEKIAITFIYLAWFSRSLLHCICGVYFFCNVDATILNLAYFDSHNPQLVD